jgi:hypothetical protein
VSGDPIGDDLRKLHRSRRLGAHAACVICGEQNPPALRRVPRSLLERHHLAGRANDPGLTVVLCLNHHALLSEAQRDSGVDLRRRTPSNPMLRAAAQLNGFADLFEQAAPSCRQLAHELATKHSDETATAHHRHEEDQR